ncbi:acyl transferase domain-containing protein/NADPH:quinone reductase-like Zn-dependent oxidoreductase/short-subunit dehydrogenase/acyl carrier protein [Amycolatopsis jiangsuensis]|uniref:Acyl transferase domain-containing protein/NADPH:quinone reductase-like Zn-dependent oxidoreductase/short-subunit dehydrogenase/acyl carrier protein n=2 Tax=Amycolatopsis jiangsuensis TaxID=1181879 RepID=A0A840J2G4_9PSEU|nr:type I polyketide synthase [Amycolatopsis jiangsuensis]MBB4689251.1 acyl transferase domain-containing protein/NADPH:quinone reductase-like Zn-dependent oxidoreductase/short-subunit dehydrogenase/acyl carrier protein [Amycolatopsis jiangsuensis]
MPNEDKLRDYLKRVSAELATARERLRAAEDRSREPIAVVGTACRLPGGADSAERLGELVAGGTDAVAPYPLNRGWDIDGLFGPDGGAGGFLADATGFDPEFFGISPREALAMDPQQRLALEVSWEALEHAGIDPAAVRGTAAGVFAGAFASGYAGGPAGSLQDEVRSGHLLTGLTTSVLSGRIAYTLGLEGPAVTVDTACSSSLVAVHLAMQALRSGECSLALAGGVTVHATPEWLVWFTRQGGLASDGRCKAYGESADGMGMAEGAGMVVLEKLSDAQRNRHRVLAVLRGSAVNSDGASNGLTAPNGPAQQRVIRAALADAALGPGEVDVVEGHGTGTRLGDPIEAQALVQTYGAGHDAERPLLLGTVKSNIGHTQAAAGVAGILKMVSALRSGVVPPTLHAAEPSSRVDWSAGTVRLVTEPTPWPDSGRPRRAGVSSFGISGTNAHLILEQAPEPPGDQPGRELPVIPWLFSARSTEALPARIEQNRALLSETDPVDAAWSLASSRASLPHRAAVLGRSGDELLSSADHLVGEAGSVGRTAFVFSGQGAQRLRMGHELCEAYPVFAETFKAVCAELDDQLGAALESERVHETEWAQAGLFAVEVSLVALLKRWGVAPEFVAGHSIGELAAAYVAGVWSLPDACKLVTARGRLMQALPRGGAMVAVAAREDDVVAALVDGAAIASVNGARSVVVSGEEAAVLATVDALGEVRSKRLTVSHAFHSPLMEPMLAEFRAVAQSLTYHRPTVPLVSGLTGAPVTDEVCDPDYWVRHVREPVRFADSLSSLRTAGVRTFVEIGPDAALTPMADPAAGEAWLPVLRRERHEPTTLVTAVAGLHVRGGHVDWPAFFSGTGANLVDLPAYPFQRTRLWLDGAVTDAAGLGQSTVEHPLLGAALERAGDDGVVLTGRVSRRSHPWLADHVVAGSTLVPGTALVELAVRAGDETGCPRVAELLIEQPLVLPERDAVSLQVTVAPPEGNGGRAFEIHSRATSGWTRHATGTLAPLKTAEPVDLSVWPPAGATPVDLEDFYPALAGNGLSYGPSFQGVRAAWRQGDDLYAEVSLPDGLTAHGFGVHPALFDASLHVLGLSGGTRVPFAWSDVVVHAEGATTVRAQLSPVGEGVRVTLADTTGSPLATVGSLSLRTFTPGASAVAREALFRVDWRPASASGDTAGWAALGDLDLPGVNQYAELADLITAVRSGAEIPPIVAVRCPADGAAGALDLVQRWVAAEDLTSAQLLVITERAVDAGPGAPVRPEAAPAWGLLRVAAAEHPGRLVLSDVEDSVPGPLLAAGVALGEPEFAVRNGELRVPRLVRAAAELTIPPAAADTGGWSLGYAGQGTLENLTLDAVENTRPLGPGEVRVGVRAAGVNFRDVLTVLGVYPGPAGPLGLEAAGVVLEVAEDVDRFQVGDPVMGIFTSAFSPVAITDARLLLPVPADWSWAEAAAAPVAYATAQHALVGLAGLGAGESVLVHAAAGGVGQAAVQIALHRGAEVFATASPAKWPVVRALGCDRLASSRTLDFEAEFTGGIDVVLSALTGEFIDASLRLMAPGGRFVEMGKTDPRDPAEVRRDHDVRYEAFDLLSEGVGTMGPVLAALAPLLAGGVLRPLPVTCWDVRHAAEAFRYLSQGRNVGKVVLTFPAPVDPRGTVLVTGASGALGRLVAKHVVTARRARHVVLASRRGMAADGMPGTVATLAALGAQVRVVACDAADREAMAAVLGTIPGTTPLRAVVHAAGVLDDALVGALTPDRVDSVMRPKAGGARVLHELTRGHDLDAFVLFSSVTGIWGTPGQGNYAAANAFLDALAAHRHRLGLPATSLAWGPWRSESGMAGKLTDADWQRLARRGLHPLSDSDGLALLDAAVAAGNPVLVPARVDVSGRDGAETPPLLSALVQRKPVRATAAVAIPAASGLTARLATLAPGDRHEAVLQVVRTQAALVLGLAGPAAVGADRSFRDLGFDSLTAVELRNRLSAATELQLFPTLVFDYPAPAALATHLLSELDGGPAISPLTAALEDLGPLLAALTDPAEKAKVSSRLETLLHDLRATPTEDEATLETATDDELFTLIDDELGI